jgi:secreted trypsin-like serine protease
MWRVFLIFAILVPEAFTETRFIPRPKSVEWSGRLVGGRYAEKGQFPHMASLRTIENELFCGAAIISDRWIRKIS